MAEQQCIYVKIRPSAGGAPQSAYTPAPSEYTPPPQIVYGATGNGGAYSNPSTKKLVTTVLCDGVVFNGVSIPRGCKIYDDGSVDDPAGYATTMTVNNDIWKQIKPDGTCNAPASGDTETPSSLGGVGGSTGEGGAGSAEVGGGVADFLTGGNDSIIVTDELTLKDGTIIPVGSLIYRDGSVMFPNGRKLPSGTVTSDSIKSKGEQEAGGMPSLPLIIGGVIVAGAVGYYLYTRDKGET